MRVVDWIPCKDRLPEEEGGYLTTRRAETGLEVAELFLWFDDEGLKHWAAGGDGWPDDFQSVIAWAEMPEPYSPEARLPNVDIDAVRQLIRRGV